MTRTRTNPAVRIFAGLLALLAVVALGACSTRAESDQIILYYKSGAGDDRKFQECIEPGTSGSYPVDDVTFALPTSLRTWNIRPSGGDTDQPIRSSSKPGPNGQPGPEVAVYATAEFYLNTNCAKGKDSPIVQFWERTGRRYDLSPDGGVLNEDNWRRMLLNTFVPAEEKAVRELTREHSADDLDANANGVWKTIEDRLGDRFMQELRAKTGGDYFCGPGYDRAGDLCPEIRISITDVNFADPKIAEARAAVFAAEQKAKADLIAAQAKVQEARLLAEANKTPGYLDLEKAKLQLQAAQACASNPNCTLVVGGAAGVNVTTK